MKRSKKKIEKVAEGHTRGGLKTYRRACYDEIGGIREVDGWDGVDNLVAQMNGWETENFTEIEVHHRRITGSYFGQIWGCFEAGKFAYSMRYQPLFLVARSIHRSFRSPFLIGGLSIFIGYSYGLLNRLDPVFKPKEVAFLRARQKNLMNPFSRNKT